jgi:uncharacterized surface anchored protein
MNRSRVFLFVSISFLLLGLMGLSGRTSEAMPAMGITETPTATATTEPTFTFTPTSTPVTVTPTETNTPTPTQETPVGPTVTPPPGPEYTPTPLTPVGTPVLPTAGQTRLAPLGLLLILAGGALTLGVFLLRRSGRLL